LPKKGHVGLQDHRSPVWYRKIRIKPLDTNDAPKPQSDVQSK
jgi:hypothetical protein